MTPVDPQAAKFAALHRLPLHLICHDDVPSAVDLLPSAKRFFDDSFKRIYRQAKSRLCVSPAMRDEYRLRYGAEGVVLYPSRASDGPIYYGPSFYWGYGVPYYAPWWPYYSAAYAGPAYVGWQWW